MTHPLNGTVPAQRCACSHFAPPGEVTECKFCDCKRHVASPYAGHDPQTPPGAEAALEALKAALEPARLALAKAVDDEAAAELDLEVARAGLTLSDDCPVVGVFDGTRVTVAQRNAWVLLRTIDEERRHRAATGARKAAEKYLDVTGRQLIAQQSIAKSVGISYQGTGGRW